MTELAILTTPNADIARPKSQRDEDEPQDDE
jgi:hypothetical protein